MSSNPIRNWKVPEFNFLDNSYEVPIVYNGITYPSVTHAFAGAQASLLDLRIQISKAPLEAIEGIFQQIHEPPDDFKGTEVMRKLLDFKFGCTGILQSSMTTRQIALATKLLLTGRRPIVFGVTNCNDFWGDCSCSKHINVSGKNVLGGLIMGVRERLVGYVTNGVARDQPCSCEKPNDAFFLYSSDDKLWLKPFCIECQARCAAFLAKLSDFSRVDRFEKDWFKSPSGPSKTEKKKAVNQQITPVKSMSAVYAQQGFGGDDYDDDDYAQAWAMWGGHLPIVQKKEEKELPQNVTYYLSGRVS